MKKYLSVSMIENGTVIDHIPAGKSYKLVDILNLKNGDKVMLGVNFSSRRFGKKDIIKIDKKVFGKDEMNKIALIAPDATINIIKNSKVKEKYNLKMPKTAEGIVKCPNPKCISYLEPQTLTSKFEIISEKPTKFRCHYCEREFGEDEVGII